MISEKRIISIFRTKGGPGGSTSIADELPESKRHFLEEKLKGDRPLIARISSKDNWLAITGSQLVSSVEGQVRHSRLADIRGIVTERKTTQLLEGKRSGGPLELKLADRSLLNVWLDGGKPFVGLLNVFIYIVKMNEGRRSGRGLLYG